MLELFETIRLDILENDYHVEPDPHLNRLEKSASELGFDFDKHQTTEGLIHYIKKNPQPPGLYKLKIILAKDFKPKYSLESYTRFKIPTI